MKRPGSKSIQQVHLRLPAKLHKQLTEEADRERRSLNAHAIYVFQRHLDQKAAA